MLKNTVIKSNFDFIQKLSVIISAYSTQKYLGQLDKIVEDRKHDLIVVDGPFGGRQILPCSNVVDLVLTNLAQDFIIIFDDVECTGEQNTIRKVKEKLKENNISFTESERTSIKKQLIITGDSFEFMRYL